MIKVPTYVANNLFVLPGSSALVSNVVHGFMLNNFEMIKNQLLHCFLRNVLGEVLILDM